MCGEGGRGVWIEEGLLSISLSPRPLHHTRQTAMGVCGLIEGHTGSPLPGSGNVRKCPERPGKVRKGPERSGAALGGGTQRRQVKCQRARLKSELTIINRANRPAPIVDEWRGGEGGGGRGGEGRGRGGGMEMQRGRESRGRTHHLLFMSLKCVCLSL